MAKIVNEIEYRNRFNSIVEYVQAIAPQKINSGSSLSEADPMNNEQPEMPADPMMGGMEDPAMGGMEDPAATSPMGNAPTPQTGAETPDINAQGVEGLNPQGGEEIPTEDEPAEDDIETMEDGDEVIDIDSLTGYQKETAKGVGKVSDEIKDLKNLILQFQERVEANNMGIENLQKELEKRSPSAEEKMSLRQQKSGPFTQTIEDYWQNNAPDNYSAEDDNNGENEPKYQITKSDIDGFNDWNSIAKSFDDMAELNSLKNIFDF